MNTFGISERRACGLLGVWRSSKRYACKPDRNAELREQLVALAAIAGSASCWNGKADTSITSGCFAFTATRERV